MTQASSPEKETPGEISDAFLALWSIKAPVPTGFFQSQPFRDLLTACKQHYQFEGTIGISSALGNALQNLGLPCFLPPGRKHIAFDPAAAAQRFHSAAIQDYAQRTYLCPLNYAHELPELRMGPVSITTFSQTELGQLFGHPGIRTPESIWNRELDDFCQFTWLRIERRVAIDESPGPRALPFLYQSFDADMDAIDPHSSNFSEPVEEALFAILVMPLEDWNSGISINWRPFQIPWSTLISDDIFVSRPNLPRASTLAWEPYFMVDDTTGEEIESERPIWLYLSDNAIKEIPSWINDTHWTKVQSALRTSLIGRPVCHFLNRGFHSDGIDEFLSHVMVVDAALGRQEDYRSGKGKPFKSSHHVPARLMSLLDDKQAGLDYARLFDRRSEFVHGREMPTISGQDRLMARRLARRAVWALVEKANEHPNLTRDALLDSLLQDAKARGFPE